MKSLNTQKNGLNPWYEYRLKSTDEKPTGDIPNGSVALEFDTGKVYFYDAETQSWLEWGGA